MRVNYFRCVFGNRGFLEAKTPDRKAVFAAFLSVSCDIVKAVIPISESLWHVRNVRLTAMNSNWNAVQVIFSECLVSPDELLVSKSVGQ
jgi:hypothetical protein